MRCGKLVQASYYRAFPRNWYYAWACIFAALIIVLTVLAALTKLAVCLCHPSFNMLETTATPVNVVTNMHIENIFNRSRYPVTAVTFMAELGISKPTLQRLFKRLCEDFDWEIIYHREGEGGYTKTNGESVLFHF